jgi:hypothetical protein
MDAQTTTDLIRSIVDLLTEAYAGPPNPEETWVIDNEPDSGILGILAGVSAAEASSPGDGKEEAGSTIAANAEHLRWSLANANAQIRNETFNPNWGDSWLLIRADEAEWARLRQALRAEYETLRDALHKLDDLPSEYYTGVLALIAHAAYHLGTIRQMIARVRSG